MLQTEDTERAREKINVYASVHAMDKPTEISDSGLQGAGKGPCIQEYHGWKMVKVVSLRHVLHMKIERAPEIFYFIGYCNAPLGYTGTWVDSPQSDQDA